MKKKLEILKLSGKKLNRKEFLFFIFAMLMSNIIFQVFAKQNKETETTINREQKIVSISARPLHELKPFEEISLKLTEGSLLKKRAWFYQFSENEEKAQIIINQKDFEYFYPYLTKEDSHFFLSSKISMNLENNKAVFRDNYEIYF